VIVVGKGVLIAGFPGSRGGITVFRVFVGVMMNFVESEAWIAMVDICTVDGILSL
jgi:hypothetical protein